MREKGHRWRWPLLVALGGLGLVAHQLARPSGEDSSNPADFSRALLALIWAVPGFVVLRRTARHSIGSLLLAIGCGDCIDLDFACADDLEAAARRALHSTSVGRWFAERMEAR